jgi:hypothetical protein
MTYTGSLVPEYSHNQGHRRHDYTWCPSGCGSRAQSTTIKTVPTGPQYRRRAEYSHRQPRSTSIAATAALTTPRYAGEPWLPRLPRTLPRPPYPTHHYQLTRGYSAPYQRGLKSRATDSPAPRYHQYADVYYRCPLSTSTHYHMYSIGRSRGFTGHRAGFTVIVGEAHQYSEWCGYHY